MNPAKEALEKAEPDFKEAVEAIIRGYRNYPANGETLREMIEQGLRSGFVRGYNAK